FIPASVKCPTARLQRSRHLAEQCVLLPSFPCCALQRQSPGQAQFRRPYHEYGAFPDQSLDGWKRYAIFTACVRNVVSEICVWAHEDSGDGRPERRRGISCDFFFQAEDGIRDYKVTGVQTCALPI